MKIPLVSFLVFIMILVSGSASAYACCVDIGMTQNEKVSWGLKQSVAVFAGKVIALEKSSETLNIIATFSVDEFWKGDLGSTVEVKVADGSTGSYDVRIGTSYLIYAGRAEGNLMTGACSGNSVRSDVDGREQIEILGKGKIPEKPKR